MKIDTTRKPITITISDYEKLLGLTEFASLKARMTEVASELIRNLKTARLLSPNEIGKNVVTMNSRVTLKDLNNSREAEITLTYPRDAAPYKKRVSVLSDVGVALLGRKENDIVSWRTPNGIGRFEVKKITYQPEAEGHYYL